MVLDSGEVQVVIPIEQQDLYVVQLGTPATIEVSGQTMLGQVVSIYPEIGETGCLLVIYPASDCPENDHGKEQNDKEKHPG